ncbi:MAG TPA: hypothetical protein VLX29_11145 [Nitrospirota bacterium]|nr:hypothetical protein [Nitrospirota bacterium]
MSTRLYISGARDILTAGRTRKFRRFEAIPGGISTDLPTMTESGVNIISISFFLKCFARAVGRILVLRRSCPGIPLADGALSAIRRRLEPG